MDAKGVLYRIAQPSSTFQSKVPSAGSAAEFLSARRIRSCQAGSDVVIVACVCMCDGNVDLLEVMWNPWSPGCAKGLAECKTPRPSLHCNGPQE